jgi:hypothetical protein
LDRFQQCGVAFQRAHYDEKGTPRTVDDRPRGDAAARFASTSVSRRHATITVDGESATVADLDSKNGTFVDGKRLTAPRVLRDGVLVRFGTIEMIYRWSAGPRPTETMG